MKTLDELLKSFCGKDDYRPEMNTPFEQNGKIIATNAHSLIAIDKSKTDLTYEERARPNANKLICVENTTSTIFNISKLNITHNMVAEVDRSGITECTKCKGEGVIECEECGHEYDCPECHGDGTIGKIGLTGNQIYDPKQNYIFTTPVTVCFAWNVFSKLIDVAEFFKIDEVKWIKADSIHDNHFIIGDVLVLLMPMNTNACENPTPITI